MEKEHYYWIDNTKVFACILVVLGHFFQSMTKTNILQTNFLYEWFNNTIYYFHVPLFFVCSGFLYQRFAKVYDFRSWSKNLVRKAVDLGVPYFVFSIVTWALKTAFPEITNSEVGGLFESLFIKPISPYWYLYCLFLIFLITPTFKTNYMALLGFLVAVGLRIIGIYGATNIYAISVLLSNEIWFVIGMCLVYVPINKVNKVWGDVLLVIFAVSSFVFLSRGNQWTSLFMSTISVVGFIAIFSKHNKSNRVSSFLTKYTKTIFLMHTLFAAPMRILLINAGITSLIVHTLLGVGISIFAPVIVERAMKKMVWLGFIINPWKVISASRKK